MVVLLQIYMLIWKFVQYIDYELAYEIINQRTLNQGFNSFDDLTKVKDFPNDKLDIIQLYLTLN